MRGPFIQNGGAGKAGKSSTKGPEGNRDAMQKKMLKSKTGLQNQKTNCKADRTAKKGNNFIAQYFGETKLTFIRGCKS